MIIGTYTVIDTSCKTEKMSIYLTKCDYNWHKIIKNYTSLHLATLGLPPKYVSIVYINTVFGIYERIASNIIPYNNGHSTFLPLYLHIIITTTFTQ